MSLVSPVEVVPSYYKNMNWHQLMVSFIIKSTPAFDILLNPNLHSW